MSPEQMRASRDVDGRTDIWSLGVCLYELLSGITPFEAPTLPELFAVIIVAAPPRPLAEFRREVPVGLSDVVQKCLRKSPGDRFANVADLALALEPFAPARASGAAERVASVLYAVPTSSSEFPPDDTEAGAARPVATLAAFESGGKERIPRGATLLALGGGVAILALVLALGLVFRAARSVADTTVDAGVSAARSLATLPSAEGPVEPPLPAPLASAASSAPAPTHPETPKRAVLVAPLDRAAAPKRRPDAGEDPSKKY